MYRENRYNMSNPFKISPASIDINRSKGIGSFPASNPAYVTYRGGEQEAMPSRRALDNAPRGVGFEYNEYSNVGAGYAGDSKWSIYG